jgi:hypothetical protein
MWWLRIRSVISKGYAATRRSVHGFSRIDDVTEAQALHDDKFDARSIGVIGATRDDMSD